MQEGNRGWEAVAKTQLDRLAQREGLFEVPLVSCGDCKAVVVPLRKESVKHCPFCAGPGLLRRQDRIVRPFAWQPHGISRPQASKRLRSWLRQWPLTPRLLRRELSADHALSGVLLPYWIFDCVTTTRYSCDGQSGTFNRRFDNVLVAAGTGLDPTDLAFLPALELPQLEPFPEEAAPQDLRLEFPREGWRVGFDQAQLLMCEMARREVSSFLGNPAAEVKLEETSFSNPTFKLILRPVWIVAVRFNETPIRLLIDAIDGSVHGNLPRSRLPKTWVVVAVMIVILLIVALTLIIIGY